MSVPRGEGGSYEWSGGGGRVVRVVLGGRRGSYECFEGG